MQLLLLLFGSVTRACTPSSDVPRSFAPLVKKAPAVFLANEKAAEGFFDFFTSNIRNKNTRRAYYKAVCRFAQWCEGRGLRELSQIKPFHIAGYIEMLGLSKPESSGLSKPTVKQHLAALRMLFDWLVVGQVIEVNPAHAVRGPKHRVKKGKTPVLNRDEARAPRQHRCQPKGEGSRRH